MRDLKITENQVINILKGFFKDVDIKGEGGVLKIRPKERDSLTTLYKLKEKLKYITIKGVKGVKPVSYTHLTLPTN